MIRKAFGNDRPLLLQIVYSKRFIAVSFTVSFCIIVMPALLHYQQSVDGGYTAWSDWTECSVTCGQGIRIRVRNCTNPVPYGFGKPCLAFGPHVENMICDKLPCPVDGGYGEWSAWGVCDPDCKDGKQSRTRPCDNPAPANKGKDCPEKETQGKEVRMCDSPKPCPIHGGYSEWGAWTPCTLSCGRGTRERSRLCNKPEPKYGGKSCDGKPHDIEECENATCAPLNVTTTITTTTTKKVK